MEMSRLIAVGAARARSGGGAPGIDKSGLLVNILDNFAKDGIAKWKRS
jgi:hypothetical protein